MKKGQKTIMLMILMTFILAGLFIANVEAGNTVSVAVSCRIPTLIEMDVDSNNIESGKIEIEDIAANLCVQEETKTIYTSETRESEDSAVLYSFYEK